MGKDFIFVFRIVSNDSKNILFIEIDRNKVQLHVSFCTMDTIGRTSLCGLEEVKHRLLSSLAILVLYSRRANQQRYIAFYSLYIFHAIYPRTVIYQNMAIFQRNLSMMVRVYEIYFFIRNSTEIHFFLCLCSNSRSVNKAS